MNLISVTILTKNSRKYLPMVLAALQRLAEVVIYDTGSTDDTLEIAATFPHVTIQQGPFIGFGPTHNVAAALAKHEWIFSVDSDEVATVALVDELLALPLRAEHVYAVPRENLFNGKVIRGCGWSPDRQLRLYHRGRTSFDQAQVHEKVISDGLQEVALQGTLRHYSYENIADFLTKMQFYSDLFAKQYAGQRPSSLGHAIWHGMGAFLRSYVLKGGLRDGQEGFVISAYNAHTAFYKYLKLDEANRKLVSHPSQN